MPEIPECLHRRYRALDDLIKELNMMSHCYSSENVDPGIRLMCNFWNILKDDPDCNLAEEVQQCFSPPSEKSSCYSCSAYSSPLQRISFIRQRRYHCYMAQESRRTDPPVDPPNDPSKGPSKNTPTKESSSGIRCGKPPDAKDQPEQKDKKDDATTSAGQQSGQLTSGLPSKQASETVDKEASALASSQDGQPVAASPTSLDKRSPNLITVDREPPTRQHETPRKDPVRKNPAMIRVEPDTGKTPLAKVLTNLEQAATYDSTCSKKLKDLLTAQRKLKSQIACLEEREQKGVKLMKEADRMWAGMEDAYKEKIAESMDRQNELMKQLQEIEKSAAKWRKNKRDLESQLESINKCQMEMVTKINQKTNDLKSIDAELAAYKKKIEATKKEAEAVKAAMTNKSKASEGRIAKITLEISSLEKQLREESKQKKDKQLSGKAYIQEARKDLQNICKVLLQRRLEHEDLEAEKMALLEEINALKDSCDNCKDRCAKKQKDIAEEIKRVDIEIANYQLKCIKCNVCVDSADARTLCSDCPRCAERRECLREGDTCMADAVEECVCAKVKQMFLNNVLENMSTVLEKKVKTCTGKALGCEIVKSLNKSRNGKLNDRTKRLLQEFVLQTVKRNLNLTVVGGAVKTRCELDSETYKQLMLCLKQVKATPPSKSDKGCDVKKDPCSRWGGHTECNCPKGPKNCICTKKAPPSVKDPATCPPEPPNDPGEEVVCPHKNAPCGPECGAHSVDRVGAEVAEFRPDPCSGQTCPFGKNMRAAQCVLGPESLKSPSKTKISKHLPNYPVLDDQTTCKCGKTTVTVKDGSRTKDRRTIPRDLMIEEVMGGYHDVKPIDRVALVSKDQLSNISERRINEDGVRSNKANTYFITDAFSNKISQTSPNLAKDDLRLLLPRSIEGISKKGSQNKKHDKKLSTLKNGRGHQTEIEFTGYQGIDFIGYRTASGYLSASSSNNIRPLSYQSSSNAKQLIAEQTNKHLKKCAPIESMNSKSIGVSGVGILKKNIQENLKERSKKENINPFLVQPYASKFTDSYTDALVPYPRVDAKDEEKEVPRTIYYPTDNFVAIKVSPSGSLTMEVDETLIRELKQDKDIMFVYLKITDLGRCFLDKISVAKLDEIPLAKLKIKMTPKCAIAFEVVSDEVLDAGANSSTGGSVNYSELIKVVKTSDKKRHDRRRANSYLTEKEQIRIKSIIDHKRRNHSPHRTTQQSHTQQQAVKVPVKTSRATSYAPENVHLSWDKEIFKHVEETLIKNERDIKKLHACKGHEVKKSSSLELYKKELESLCDRSNCNLSINIIAENGISINLVTNVKRTLSGNVAFDVKVIETIGEISNLKSEHPVLLRKSSSGHYNIFIGDQYNGESILHNAVIRRTESNGLLVVITEPVNNFKREVKSSDQNSVIYKVKMKGSPDERILPAVLKSSPSHNYLIAMDKEFEKRYTDSLNSVFGDKDECFVELHEKNSVVSINFDKNAKKNAALVKTSSGTIKMLVNGPILEKLLEKTDPNQSSQDIENLLNKASHVPGNSSSERSKIANVKSNSDSNFYHKSKLNDSLFSGSIPKFQRTESGQFAAIIDKESKKSFLNDLKNQIANYPQNRIPIKRTDSGEITIILDSDEAEPSQFESLRITPSGNLYLVVDEKALKDIYYKENKNLVTSSDQLQFGSEHMIGKIKDPKNKATGTSKNDDTQKFDVHIESFGKQKCSHVTQPKGNYFCNKEDCDAKTCTTACCSSQKGETRKPCSCSLGSIKSSDVDSYYFTESLYRYEDKRLSEDITAVTSFCKRILNDFSGINSRTSLKSVSIESSSSVRWKIPMLRDSSSSIIVGI